ncbi:MAG: YjjG family noncanonical pyrimidine nucleotidase [Bacteroidota bacterium]
MENTKITNVFFDLDHTLWDFDKNSAITFKQIFETENLAIPYDLFMQTYVPLNLAFWKKYRMNEITKEELRYSRLAEVFKAINYAASDELIDLIANKYIEYLSEQTHLFPGTHEVLNDLKSRYSLHIITNGFDEVQYKKLDKSGLKNYFSTVTTSEDVNYKKPHPKVFEFALEKAQTNVESSIMIGDNLEADIQGALAFGMDAIYFGTEKSFTGKRVEHLMDLKKYL